ncbi:MAG: PD-(D/E)XK nuclease family protein [Spirochaetaceae bacterium]|jgi:CRISPR/Cas system-associated exonuclease Cas4 (RecB family)|nr:PD-(D/E)XK nuclease family protein [Spirochaetaceae bacterium]
MRSILEYIAEALPDRRVTFVFPSAAPVRFWAETAAEILQIPLTPLRFCAWDVFKEKTFSIKQPDKQPIKRENQALRTLFASSLLKKNAQKDGRFLRDYINPAYADSYTSFIGPLAELLPGLDGILRRYEKNDKNDAYFADLQQIRERYAAFLETHRLYEPAWNPGKYTSSGDRWYLFFPDLASDWEEYREELIPLNGSEEIRILSLSEIRPPDYPDSDKIRQILNVKDTAACIQFAFAGEEYRWLALTIRRLLDEARLCPADIVLTINVKSDTERLLQTLRLYDIPAELREGQALTDYPGGRIFSALSGCPGGQWSYRALKNLLLDKAFPWKDEKLIDAFLNFGIKYRCVSGFSGIDVWERTFEWHKDRPQRPDEIPIAEIHKFYQTLKKAILAILQASHFKDIKAGWFAFKKTFFKEEFDPEVNKIIGKIIEYLDELAEIEKQYPGLFSGGKQTFSVFQSYIQEQKYVYQAQRGNIAIYDYKVAAGIAPAAHFILSMNQENASVVYGGETFLREDRKQSLGMQDRDVSGEFIQAYRFSGSFPVFTVSLKTFRGPAVPHRRLLELLGEPAKVQDFPADPYLAEAALADGGSADSTVCPGEMQKQGWQGFCVLTKPPRPGDIRRNPVADSRLREALAERLGRQASFRDGNAEPLSYAYLSPTDLNEYIYCPFKWILERGLQIKEKQTGIKTIDQRDLGSLYHAILENFFKRLKTEDRPFRKELLEVYTKYIEEETQKALKKARGREGAFQESIYAMLEQRICAALTDYLREDAAVLDGAKIVDAEYLLQKIYPGEDLRLIGKADVVMIHKAGGFILTDFKARRIPAKKKLFAEDQAYPEDLQMAAYIAMLEDKSQTEEVGTARFYSIDNRAFQYVVSEQEENEKKVLSRRDYEPEVASVDVVFGLAAEALKQGVYPAPKNPDPKKCAACDVSGVCRIPFIGGAAGL